MKYGLRILATTFIFILNFTFGQNFKINNIRQQLAQEELTPEEHLNSLSSLSNQLKAYSTDSVRKYALRYQELAIKYKNQPALSESYRLLAWARGLMQQNIAQLLKDGQQALQIAEEANDSLGIVYSGLMLTTGLIAMRKPGEAQKYVDLALAYGKSHQNQEILYEAYSSAAYLALLSDLQKSQELREKALSLAEEMQDSIKMGISLSQLAGLMKLQKSDLTEQYLQRAKQIYARNPAPLYEGIFLFNLAEYYGDLGYSDSLLYYGLKANSLADQSQNIQVQRVVKSLLFAYYFNRNEYAKAAPFARKVLEIEQAKPSLNYVSAFVDVARVRASLGEKDSAEYYFKQAQAATQLVHYPRAEVLARVYFGEFLKNQKRYPEALEQLREARALGKEKNEAAVRDFVLLQLAEVEFLSRNYSASKAYYQEALELGEEKNEADLFAQVYEGMAKCDSALGNWSSAYMNQNDFLRWNDSVLNRNYNERVAEYEVEFETAQREAEIIQLEQEQRIQALELSQTKTQRSFFLGIAIILALAGIIVGILSFRLKAQNAEIQAQQKKLIDLNQTKDQLFAMISHDLRGPITGFQSAGKIFDHYLEKGDYQQLSKISDKLNNQATQVRQLLDNLLNWSLQQLGRYEGQATNINLRALGEQILQRYQAHADAKNNQLVLDVEDKLNWHGDKNGLSVALNNLIGNAMKFTKDGSIVLSAKSHPSEKNLVIEIRDTGVGMTEAQRDRLFCGDITPSEAGTSGEKGTGLGNQIVRQLVDYWGGRVEVESQLGQGTLIRMVLPEEVARLAS